MIDDTMKKLAAEMKDEMIRRERNAPLTLISRHPKVVYVDDPCAKCGKYFKALYRFAKSNKGSVLLCPDCAVPLQEEAFGKEDLMSYVETPGGFESKRSRH